jgi:hypothetical protein
MMSGASLVVNSLTKDRAGLTPRNELIDYSFDEGFYGKCAISGDNYLHIVKETVVIFRNLNLENMTRHLETARDGEYSRGLGEFIMISE